eukprot:358521-Chlamydomonas_euryale.AAC.6
MKSLDRDMCEHLKEEELLGLPKMRHAFTQKEVAVAEDKITKVCIRSVRGAHFYGVVLGAMLRLQDAHTLISRPSYCRS